MSIANVMSGVYGELTDASVTALLSQAYSVPAVFTDVPQPADAGATGGFPFIAYGLQSLVPYNDKTRPGGNALVRVAIYARAASDDTMNGIIDAVRLQMERSDLGGLAGRVTVELESANVADDPDGRTRQCVMLWRVLYLT